jgi:hypothetical protein
MSARQRAEADRVAEGAARLAARLDRITAGGGDAGILAAGLAGALGAVTRWLREVDTGSGLAELRFTRAQAASELLEAVEAGLAKAGTP